MVSLEMKQIEYAQRVLICGYESKNHVNIMIPYKTNWEFHIRYSERLTVHEVTVDCPQ